MPSVEIFFRGLFFWTHDKMPFFRKPVCTAQVIISRRRWLRPTVRRSASERTRNREQVENHANIQFIPIRHAHHPATCQLVAITSSAIILRFGWLDKPCPHLSHCLSILQWWLRVQDTVPPPYWASWMKPCPQARVQMDSCAYSP